MDDNIIDMAKFCTKREAETRKELEETLELLFRADPMSLRAAYLMERASKLRKAAMRYKKISLGSRLHGMILSGFVSVLSYVHKNKHL